MSRFREYLRNKVFVTGKQSIFYLDTYGYIAIASFLICTVSGILLAIPYDVANPYDSIAKILMTNPAGVFYRNIHYWSAQLFLIFTILHTYDHFKRATEKRVKKGVWFRLTVSLLVTFLVMLSGFILKGDLEAQQAKRILEALFNEIPLIGSTLTYSLLGPENDYEILYVHHIATATIFLAIITIEHARTIWTKGKTFLVTTLFTLILSYLFTPALHDNLNPLIKGPWYFLGLQEILHWISQPAFSILLVIGVLIAIYYLPKLTLSRATILKKGILVLSLAYLVLTIFAYYFRGENWNFTTPWESTELASVEIKPVVTHNDFTLSELREKEIPNTMGKPEGCLFCHSGIEGFSQAHNPEAIGCSSCHHGDPFTLNADKAHSSMVRIPGNLADSKRSCGLTDCHPNITERVPTSIMSTLSGMVSVNRYVFGEIDTSGDTSHIQNIGYSSADSHLRDLCASCHLGNQKTEYGPITQTSRGGGCNACHLNYSKDSKRELAEFKEAKLAGKDFEEFKFHPELSLNITDEHCFGCHSRSGRIATNYQGYHETLLDSIPKDSDKKYRKLEDGRIFEYVREDVHHKAGMECIDCHNSFEVMGDGNFYLHKEKQVKIECEDCHSIGKPETKKYSDLDEEFNKILKLRYIEAENREFLTVKETGRAIINTYINDKNETKLVTKNSQEELDLNPPDFVCTEGKAHSELSCNSCHSDWAPQCIGCHTEYDEDEKGYDLLKNKYKEGSWVEHIGIYLPESPTLGVVQTQDSIGNKQKEIHTFIPGMILSIDKESYPNSKEDETVFRRMYSPTSAHTTVTKGRDCKSCHNSPLAIGYGRGKLEYITKGKFGKWKFTPKYQNNQYDGLPEDAWIGFLQERSEYVSTRSNMRPFNLEEQKNILTAGACLACHEDDSKVMKDALYDFEKVLENASDECVLPKWR